MRRMTTLGLVTLTTLALLAAGGCGQSRIYTGRVIEPVTAERSAGTTEPLAAVDPVAADIDTIRPRHRN